MKRILPYEHSPRDRTHSAKPFTICANWFRDCFFGFDAEAWDEQFEENVAAEKLDALADEAIQALREGRCSNL